MSSTANIISGQTQLGKCPFPDSSEFHIASTADSRPTIKQNWWSLFIPAYCTSSWLLLPAFLGGYHISWSAGTQSYWIYMWDFIETHITFSSLTRVLMRGQDGCVCLMVSWGTSSILFQCHPQPFSHPCTFMADFTFSHICHQKHFVKSTCQQLVLSPPPQTCPSDHICNFYISLLKFIKTWKRQASKAQFLQFKLALCV